jgi:hypothetical protein
MNHAGKSGGSQWESNVDAALTVGKLQIPETDRTDKIAKNGRTAYNGVQRRKHSPSLTIPEWRQQQRARPAQITPVDWSRIPAEERFYSVEDLHSVFSPTQPTGIEFDDDIRILCGEIAGGFIEVRAVKIPYATLVPNVGIARLDQQWLRHSRNESQEHRDLKVLGICWLRHIGAQRAAGEMECRYGSADAYSADLNFAVECGNTAIWRVFTVKGGSPAGILVLPYEAGEADHYNGVLFTQGPYLKRAGVSPSPYGGQKSEG